jgi:hypothetical protein
MTTTLCGAGRLELPKGDRTCDARSEREAGV